MDAERSARQGKRFARIADACRGPRSSTARALRGDADNLFAIADRRPWTHLRLNIFPDGGVARLRVLRRGARSTGLASPGPAARSTSLSILNGGLVARRQRHALRRARQHDHARTSQEHGRRLGDAAPARPGLRLGDRPTRRTGLVTRVEIDTNHYKGNYPESASIEGCLAPGARSTPSPRRGWREILPRTTLRAAIIGTTFPRRSDTEARSLTCGSTSFPTAASAGSAFMEPWQRLDTRQR